jgi:hypothetical protein
MQERGVPRRRAAEILFQNGDLKAAPRRAEGCEQADWASAHDEDLSGFNWRESIDGRVHLAYADATQKTGQVPSARQVHIGRNRCGRGAG